MFPRTSVVWETPETVAHSGREDRRGAYWLNAGGVLPPSSLDNLSAEPKLLFVQGLPGVIQLLEGRK